MKNFKADGDSVTVVAGGTITSGSVVKVGTLIGVAQNSAVSAGTYVLYLKGIFTGLPKTTGAAWAQGDLLYWSGTEFNKVANGGTVAGFAAADALSAATTGEVLLIPATEYAQAATVAANATANGSDLATTQALANSLKTSVNAILTALKDAGVMATS